MCNAHHSWKEAVQEQLPVQTKTDGRRKLVAVWMKRIEKQRDYV
jgi:hypothetical protein